MAETLANAVTFPQFSASTAPLFLGGVERGGWSGGRSRRGRWHAGDIHTLLGPEKTSTPPARGGFGFSEHAIAIFLAYRQGFVSGVGCGVVVGCWLRCA